MSFWSVLFCLFFFFFCLFILLSVLALYLLMASIDLMIDGKPRLAGSMTLTTHDSRLMTALGLGIKLFRFYFGFSSISCLTIRLGICM